MIFKIENCNSIDYAQIEVTKNALNVFYAINGTGKSTIAKALASMENAKKLEELTPFKYLDNRDETHKPNVSSSENITNISIFNEEYVSQYVFKTDEIIQNSFEIFIKTPNYDQQLQIINGLVKEAKNTFAQNPELDELIGDFTTFIDGFGKAQSGYSAAGSLGKGLGKGNKVYNIPETLQPFKDYIQSSENGVNAKWLKWHLSGNEFMDISHQCPYCTSETSAEIKKTILNVSEEFDPKTIEHLNKMLDVFEKLKNYFSEDTNQKIKEISQSVSGISAEQKAFLLEIKEQVVTLKDKLWKIKTLSFTSLKDVDKVVNEVSSYKIDLGYLSHLNAEYSREKIKLINTVLDAILVKATEIQAAIGKQNSTIKKAIQEYSNEINSFLKYAGYKYAVLLEDDHQGSYKLKLRHIDAHSTINNANLHLSFGERNAFALILFMYQTLKANPDIIILDDPISSFDGNKKYAILYKLFKEKRSFKDKTVVLLTHEFGTIIDTIYNMPSTINAVGIHLFNRNGTIVENCISRDKIKPFPIVVKENMRATGNEVTKLVYLRRFLDVENNKGEAWQLLSNLFKDERETPLFMLSDGTCRTMTTQEIEDATSTIAEYIDDAFDYSTNYQLLQDKQAMVSLYINSNSNYEKLQLYRIINNHNSSNNIIKKFVNETFHVENDYLFQLNPIEYEIIPEYVINACDEDIKKLYPNAFLSTVEDNNDFEQQFSSVQESKNKIHLYDLPASAGTGHWIDETGFTEVLVSNTSCDYAARISGDSMLPDIPDGSVVLIKFEPNISLGEIGIFTLNGSVFCKQLGKTALISLNTNYEPICLTEYDDLLPQGKVVEIIRPSHIAEQIQYL